MFMNHDSQRMSLKYGFNCLLVISTNGTNFVMSVYVCFNELTNGESVIVICRIRHFKKIIH